MLLSQRFPIPWTGRGAAACSDVCPLIGEGLTTRLPNSSELGNACALVADGRRSTSVRTPPAAEQEEVQQALGSLARALRGFGKGSADPSDGSNQRRMSPKRMGPILSNC